MQRIKNINFEFRRINFNDKDICKYRSDGLFNFDVLYNIFVAFFEKPIKSKLFI